MDNSNVFYLKCPEFGAGGYDLGEHDVKFGGIQSYAHPVDSKITGFLDMPGVKSLFGSVIDVMTDLKFSQIISSGVPVSETSFPDINKIINHCVSVLGIKRPYVVVSGSVDMNAFTIGSDEEPYVVLGNTLVKVMDKPKLTFILGHECGHIAMGHVIYHSIVSSAASFFNAVPVIGPALYNSSSFALSAWSRRSEITADRAGLLCCEDTGEAERALIQLQTGFISANKIDVKAYIKNSKRYRRGGALRRINEFMMTHPPLPKRIEALALFARSEVYYSARGLEAPKGCLARDELAGMVENILEVLGDE